GDAPGGRDGVQGSPGSVAGRPLPHGRVRKVGRLLADASERRPTACRRSLRERTLWEREQARGLPWRSQVGFGFTAEGAVSAEPRKRQPGIGPSAPPRPARFASLVICLAFGRLGFGIWWPAFPRPAPTASSPAVTSLPPFHQLLPPGGRGK